MKLIEVTKRLGILFLLASLPLMLASCASSGSSSGSSSSNYNVDQKRNVNSVRIQKVGEEENRVEIILKTRGSMTGAGAENVRMSGSSGVQQSTSSFRGYDDVTFPFSGRVAFEYTKQKFDVAETGNTGETTPFASTVSASFSYEITEKGHWVVTAYY